MTTAEYERLCGKFSMRRGAPMGQSSYFDDPEPGTKTTPLRCFKVRFVDGDYAPNGVYWGGGRDSLPIYCITNGENVLIFVRASTRKSAKDVAKKNYPSKHFTWVN